MPPGGQQGQQSSGGGDQAYSIVWIMAFLMIAAYASWYFFHTEITRAVLFFRLWEAKLVYAIVGGLSNTIHEIITVPASDFTPEVLWALSTNVGEYYRYPLITVLLLLAGFLYSRDATRKYRKTYTMHSLLHQEKEHWANLTPILDLDLVKQDLDKGPWAMALSPRAFALKNKLLKKLPPEQQSKSTQDRDNVLACIHKNEARRLFIMQLGQYWTGLENLPPHISALFAVFSAKINRDRESTERLLRQLSESSTSKKMDYSGISELLAKYAHTEEVLLVTQKHAYILTMMASLIAAARQDGVFATSTFLWLKPIDRRLWYMLNSVGRQTPFTEVAGPFAHWLVEKNLRRPCLVPMVDEAVNALDEAVREIKFKPQEIPE